MGDWPAVAIFLGLLASVAYGFADFIGGLMSRPNHVFTVLLWGQVIGIAWVLASLPLLAGGPPTADALLWGAGSGVAGTFGAAALFPGKGFDDLYSSEVLYSTFLALTLTY